MNRRVFSCLLLAVASFVQVAPLGRAADTDGGSLAIVLSQDENLMQITITNPSEWEQGLSLTPRGVWKTESGARYVCICESLVTVPAHRSVTVSVPVVAVSSKIAWVPKTRALQDSAQVFSNVPECAEPRIQPLAIFAATRNDLPRRTLQIVALALIEDISFTNWQQSAIGKEPQPAAGVSDLALALDAVAILKSIVPGKEFALANDSALKLKALHDPALRTKALQIYGLTITGDAPAGGVAPDLGQLLHTKPGDNCPICRMRAQQASPDNAP